jgi:hypothetical protein
MNPYVSEQTSINKIIRNKCQFIQLRDLAHRMWLGALFNTESVITGYLNTVLYTKYKIKGKTQFPVVNL